MYALHSSTGKLNTNIKIRKLRQMFINFAGFNFNEELSLHPVYSSVWFFFIFLSISTFISQDFKALCMNLMNLIDRLITSNETSPPKVYSMVLRNAAVSDLLGSVLKNMKRFPVWFGFFFMFVCLVVFFFGGGLNHTIINYSECV